MVEIARAAAKVSNNLCYSRNSEKNHYKYLKESLMDEIMNRILFRNYLKKKLVNKQLLDEKSS